MKFILVHGELGKSVKLNAGNLMPDVCKIPLTFTCEVLKALLKYVTVVEKY